VLLPWSVVDNAGGFLVVVWSAEPLDVVLADLGAETLVAFPRHEHPEHQAGDNVVSCDLLRCPTYKTVLHDCSVRWRKARYSKPTPCGAHRLAGEPRTLPG
jgi:hypothetical protein